MRAAGQRCRWWRILAAATLAVSCQGASCQVSAPVGPDRGAPLRPPGIEGVAVTGTRVAWSEPETVEMDFRRIADVGATWVRFDIPWSQISWAPGQADWSRVDRAVQLARTNGLCILGVIGTLANHAGGTTWRTGPATVAQRRAFAEFAGTAATRYRGQVTAWEVWNEPNVDQAWSPTPSAEHYADLLSRTYPALKSGCPNCLVIAGGTGGAVDPPDIDTLQWYRRLYELGADHFFDAVAVHPYSDMVRGDRGEIALTPRLRELMDTYGDTDASIWGTEFGVPTVGQRAVSESDAARLMAEAARAWAGMRGTSHLFWYTLVDSEDPASHGAFGVYRADGSAKPLLDSLRGLTPAGRGGIHRGASPPSCADGTATQS